MNLMSAIDAKEVPAAALDGDELWYKDAIVYQLHVKAFADSNNDGIGDFAGLTEKLDYLQDLGVTALWLLPFYPSPGRDDGYDIADYGAINPDFGTMKDFRRFIVEAKRRGLRVIEDAAHAIGSAYYGKRIGSFGDLVCFSFHPNKNITTIEGGAISGGSAAELRSIELHRWHGQVKTGPDSFDTLLAGGKSNLSDVAAAVGLGQLRHLEEFNTRRRALVARYFELWGEGAPLRLPERGDEGHSWHVFTPLLPLERLSISRVAFIEEMKARGIGVGVHYPAIHLFSAYRALGYAQGQFPNAERIGRETVTLPLFPAMEPADVDRVVRAVNEVLGGARK